MTWSDLSAERMAAGGACLRVPALGVGRRRSAPS